MMWAPFQRTGQMQPQPRPMEGEGQTLPISGTQKAHNEMKIGFKPIHLKRLQSHNVTKTKYFKNSAIFIFRFFRLINKKCNETFTLQCIRGKTLDRTYLLLNIQILRPKY